MHLNEIPFIFNRAFFHTFSKKKLLIAFLVLLLCGVLAVFFRGLATAAGPWVKLSLTFLPIFLWAGILQGMGIFLIRVYHDEVKHKNVSFNKVLKNSWSLILGATYFAIPIILVYLLLWMFLGLFVLLSKTPGIGEFFSVILSFGPFLISLMMLVLIVLNIVLLFFVTPILALKGLNKIQVSDSIVKRFKKDLFTNLYLLFVSSIPLFFVSLLLTLASVLTGALFDSFHAPLHTVLMWFFVMVPFTAFLAPAVVFFFNFAAEAHVLMQAEKNTSSDTPAT